MRRVCRAALPAGYFARYIESATPTALNNGGVGCAASTADGGEPIVHHHQQQQIVAVGSVCPTPVSLNQPSITTQHIALTSKHMQVAHIVIACAQANGSRLTHSWEPLLATLQHLVWILGADSSSASAGGGTTGSNSSNSVLTTAAMHEMPDLVNMTL